MMPLGGLLVRMGRPQHRNFIKGPPAQLETYWQPFLGKPAGYGNGGKPIDVEGTSVLG